MYSRTATIIRLYKKLAANDQLYGASKTGIYWMEHPSDEDPDVVVRLFMNKQDAQKYVDTLANHRVDPIAMKELWDLIPELQSVGSILSNGHPTRIDVCVYEEDSLVTVDTLYHPFASIN